VDNAKIKILRNLILWDSCDNNDYINNEINHGKRDITEGEDAREQRGHLEADWRNWISWRQEARNIFSYINTSISVTLYRPCSYRSQQVQPSVGNTYRSVSGKPLSICEVFFFF
jgi:hypothetical protein